MTQGLNCFATEECCIVQSENRCSLQEDICSVKDLFCSLQDESYLASKESLVLYDMNYSEQEEFCSVIVQLKIVPSYPDCFG